MNLTRHLEVTGPFGIAPLSRVELRAAKKVVGEYRARFGFDNVTAPLLTPPAANVKIAKSEVPGWSLSLAPANSSTVANVCAYSTPTCRRYCVAYSGNGGFPLIARARAWKVALLSERPGLFVRLLAHEIRSAARSGAITVRLNVFSDLRWELIAPELFTIEGVKFYDYTKHPASKRFVDGLNYHLTYSATENTTLVEIAGHIDNGRNVAVVIPHSRFMKIPDTFYNLPAIAGDKTDDRTTDPNGVIVLLTAKGKLRTSTDIASVKFRHGNVKKGKVELCAQ